jgi:hypothetical protein
MNVIVSLEDWNAIRKFIRAERGVYLGSFGIPGRMRQTWREEYSKADPQSYRTFEAAEKAISRGRSARGIGTR